MASADGLLPLLRTADPWAVDLLLSMLAAAAGSKRRVTCTTPFPSHAFESADGTRDYAALLENLQSLPAASALAAAVESLSRQQAALLAWLLAHPKRPVGPMRRVSLRQMQGQLDATLAADWLADVGRNPTLKPHAVVQLSGLPASLAAGCDRLLCFHGTGLENMHSILHHGLLNASGTRLERTGYVFGKGIYFSLDPHVAFAFSTPGDGWRHSALGSRLRCLMACSVAREHARGSQNADLVPDRYLVVDRMDAVQIHFVLVYMDAPGNPAAAAAEATPAGLQAGPQAGAQARLPPPWQRGAAPGGPQPQQQRPRQQRSPLLYIIAAYVGWMLLVSLRDNWPYVRRVLRRKFGIRL